MASIEARYKKNRLYIRFRFGGRAFKEPSPFYCVKDGKKGCRCKQCQAAEAMALEIERKITLGTFKVLDYFPDSKAVQEEKLISVSSDILFPQYVMQWLDLKESVMAYSTMRSYKHIQRKLTPYLKSLKLADIRPSHIRNIVTQLSNDGLSPKTIKNCIFMLSNVFEYALTDGIISANPVRGVQLPKVKVEEPDPFTVEEISMILRDMNAHRPHMTAFFAVGFYTGMRTGEIMALKWENIDFNKHKIFVTATHTNNKIKDTTKSGQSRYVDIIEELDSYLLKQKQHTFLQNTYLFLNQYNRPFLTQNSIVTVYWKPCLQRLGIRYREPYQMRHTFACMMLDAGENLKWIANTLGHTDLSMVTKWYGNWYAVPDGRAGQRFKNKAQKV